jgi:hypothetical protein
MTRKLLAGYLALPDTNLTGTPTPGTDPGASQAPYGPQGLTGQRQAQAAVDVPDDGIYPPVQLAHAVSRSRCAA